MQNGIDMEEIWKEIEGYPNYMISNFGRVKSLNYRGNTGKEKILKSIKNNNGYILIALYKEGIQKMFIVHRLVAQTFLPNPNNLTEVNHKDEDKTNNRVENLEWCDSKYNTNYGTRNEKISKPILQFSKTGEFIRKWESGTQVEKELGINQGNISKCLKGKYKSAYGFVWMYANINGFDIDINKLKKAA